MRYFSVCRPHTQGDKVILLSALRCVCMYRSQGGGDDVEA